MRRRSWAEHSSVSSADDWIAETSLAARGESGAARGTASMMDKRPNSCGAMRVAVLTTERGKQDNASGCKPSQLRVSRFEQCGRCGADLSYHCKRLETPLTTTYKLTANVDKRTKPHGRSSATSCRDSWSGRAQRSTLLFHACCCIPA